jgi:thymidine kinase
MGKLYFRHGAVSSAKTLNLLAVAHNYRQQGKGVLLMKPVVSIWSHRLLLLVFDVLRLRLRLILDDAVD